MLFNVLNRHASARIIIVREARRSLLLHGRSVAANIFFLIYLKLYRDIYSTSPLSLIIKWTHKNALLMSSWKTQQNKTNIVNTIRCSKVHLYTITPSMSLKKFQPIFNPSIWLVAFIILKRFSYTINLFDAFCSRISFV